MRAVGGVALWVVATLIGLSAAGWFSLAGVGWSNGFIKRSYWEANEGEIGVGFGLVALLVWLVLLLLSVFVLRGDASAPGRRVGSVVAAAISIALVVTVCVLVIAWPEPPSEYPLPPWKIGRAHV